MIDGERLAVAVPCSRPPCPAAYASVALGASKRAAPSAHDDPVVAQSHERLVLLARPRLLLEHHAVTVVCVPRGGSAGGAAAANRTRRPSGTLATPGWSGASAPGRGHAGTAHGLEQRGVVELAIAVRLESGRVFGLTYSAPPRSARGRAQRRSACSWGGSRLDSSSRATGPPRTPPGRATRAPAARVPPRG